MSLIIEDGSGIVDANSYVSIQEVMGYFRMRNLCPKISEGDLIASAEFLDVIYGSKYRGTKATTTQGLLFPRTQFYNSLGELVEANTIPEQLKIAQFHAAKLSSEGISLVSNVNPDDNLKSLKQSVDGAVSQEKTWFSPSTRKETAFIAQYILPIIDNSRSNRTIRA